MNETEIQIRIMAMVAPHKAYTLLYYADHKYCPKCGDDSCISTLANVSFDPNDPSTFKDHNRSTCCKCGYIHTIHERVKYALDRTQ